MNSDRRIQASRANGAKSKGPKTLAGKLRSSRNSRRHGLLARTIVLDNERPSAFAALLSSFEFELDPAGEIEQGCVENMAVARWRMMRLWGIEKAGFEFEMSKQPPGLHDAATRAAIAFRSLCDDSRAADLLNRYETRYDRQYTRALNTLLKLKNFQTNPVPKSDTEGPP
jgi:hypothetical protein